MSFQSPTEYCYGVVIPVYNEEECLGAVLDELRNEWPGQSSFEIAVGLNGTTDLSGEIASQRGAIVGQTDHRGYGHGCMAAIDAFRDEGIGVDAYIFFAGDGASDPEDLKLLIDRFEAGNQLVLGTRTTSCRNWRRPWRRGLANLVLGAWATLLSGHVYADLGPHRIIDRNLFEKMDQKELTWGWTIEQQILAPKLGAKISSVRVGERSRIAGVQKISGVSLKQTLKIGWEIFKAGFRSAKRTFGGPSFD
ncbi:MAG: glycosyltransferase family 2 protein [Verrucomicrobiota bacterium]